jgi:hypothetical protein
MSSFPVRTGADARGAGAERPRSRRGLRRRRDLRSSTAGQPADQSQFGLRETHRLLAWAGLSAELPFPAGSRSQPDRARKKPAPPCNKVRVRQEAAFGDAAPAHNAAPVEAQTSKSTYDLSSEPKGGPAQGARAATPCASPSVVRGPARNHGPVPVTKDEDFRRLSVARADPRPSSGCGSTFAPHAPRRQPSRFGC